MVTIYKGRGNTFQKHLATEAAKDSKDTRSCPHCGDITVLIESYTDRDTFKCNKCKSENTYTKAHVPSITTKKNEKKLSIIKLRDVSKEKEKPKEEKKPEEEQKPKPQETGVIIPMIKKGLKERKLIQFDYFGQGGQKTTRLAEPYKLTLDKNKQPVLYAFCTDGNGIRLFKLCNIFNLTVQDFSFEARWPIEDLLVEN